MAVIIFSSVLTVEGIHVVVGIFKIVEEVAYNIINTPTPLSERS